MLLWPSCMCETLSTLTTALSLSRFLSLDSTRLSLTLYECLSLDSTRRLEATSTLDILSLYHPPLSSTTLCHPNRPDTHLASQSRWLRKPAAFVSLPRRPTTSVLVSLLRSNWSTLPCVITRVAHLSFCREGEQAADILAPLLLWRHFWTRTIHFRHVCCQSCIE